MKSLSMIVSESVDNYISNLILEYGNSPLYAQDSQIIDEMCANLNNIKKLYSMLSQDIKSHVSDGASMHEFKFEDLGRKIEMLEHALAALK